MVGIEEVLIEHWEQLPMTRSKELEWSTIIEAMRDYGNKYHENEIKKISFDNPFCNYCGNRKRFKGDGRMEQICTC